MTNQNDCIPMRGRFICTTAWLFVTAVAATDASAQTGACCLGDASCVETNAVGCDLGSGSCRRSNKG